MSNCGQHKCKNSHNCGSCGVKRGKWIEDMEHPLSWKCSNCGHYTHFCETAPNYCPHCGAKMDLEEQDNA